VLVPKWDSIKNNKIKITVGKFGRSLLVNLQFFHAFDTLPLPRNVKTLFHWNSEGALTVLILLEIWDE